MAQIKIITDNAADRASVTVPSTAAGLGADRLKTDIKGEVCRVLSGSATITLAWPTAETIGAVVIPASNLGPSSTIRVRAYADAAGATLLQDSGVQWAAPGTTLAHWDFAQPLNVNQFADGTAPLTACYLPEQAAVRKLVIDITNPGSPFIDISRLVAGAVHAPQYCAGYGAQVGTQDMTKNSRAASGDLKSDWGPKASTLQFELGWIADSDRERVRQLLARGVGRWLFVSLLAGCSDPVKERDYSIYGKPSQPGSMAYASYGLHSSTFNLEGF